ncbi:hypothetical protein POPTR_008G182400v4 [Populus trichocarpa]|jgi:hypothetical protein|uniref:Anther-specific protein BCP1 n=1 Tax=Populus trichocarpa TaxID=3694 RepID=B9HLD0_POPTR|nr:anther-specific protein BCP1 [Populus trichocarpa]KAI5580613.1 hypothetical protein BDE02_08G165400 [Populus trichocarpa]PNT25376.1 hypothetical protein POPTR_008G182400v4 [Populus trichocarpa]|eukprot:XP_002311748.1 anther-specific protein BCP1 [Populus trichocarpa]
MASKVIVLALVFVAIVGLASAAGPAPSTTALPAEAPLSDDFIGTDDAAAAGAPSGGDAVVPGPMGSVEAAGGPSGSPKSDSAALKFSAITGVAAVAGYLFF